MSTRSRQRKNAGVPDGQLPLPLFERGLQAAHNYPLVATPDKVIRGRRPAREAWIQWHLLETNPPTVYTVMIFDIDDPDQWEYEAKTPVPNWEVHKNSRPATYHVAYTMANPVARHDAARLGPLRYDRDVYDGLSVLIGADHRYNGLLTKNPLNPPPGCTTHWLRREPYDLAELRDWLPAVIPKPVHTTGVGRNEDLFRFCVKLAHRPGWARTIAAEGHAGLWLDHVRLLNIQQFAENPLPDSECRSIAKSCAKYSLSQFREGIFSDIQAERGRRRAQQRWHPNQPDFDYQSRAETVTIMFDLGYSRKWLAHHFSVSVITIDRDLAKIRKARRNAPSR